MSNAGRGRTRIFNTPDIHSQITLILNGLVRVSLCRQNRRSAVRNQHIQVLQPDQADQRPERKLKALLEDQNEVTSIIESQVIQVSYILQSQNGRILRSDFTRSTGIIVL